jgi:hypothetical protein
MECDLSFRVFPMYFITGAFVVKRHCITYKLQVSHESIFTTGVMKEMIRN